MGDDDELKDDSSWDADNRAWVEDYVLKEVAIEEAATKTRNELDVIFDLVRDINTPQESRSLAEAARQLIAVLNTTEDTTAVEQELNQYEQEIEEKEKQQKQREEFEKNEWYF